MPDEPRRAALVTGAGRGLGLAIAEQLAAMGMKVITTPNLRIFQNEKAL